MDYMLLLALVAFALMIWRMAVLWSRGPRARAAFQRGVDALNTNALKDAETAFREVIRIEPIWAVAYRLLGRVLADLGKTEEAEKQFRTAITLEPRNSDGYADLGFFLTVKVQDRGEDAVTAFATAVELSPGLRQKLGNVPDLLPLLNNERFRRLLASEDIDRITG